MSIKTVPVTDAQAEQAQRKALETAGVRVSVSRQVLERALAQSAKSRRRSA